MRPASTSAACLVLAIALAGCVAGPNFHAPEVSPRDSYGEPAVGVTDGEAAATRYDLGADIPLQWWRVFHNADLDALVAEALGHSPTIASARAALRAANELVKSQRAAFYPNLSASIQPSHQAFAHDLASPTQAGTSVYDLNTTQVSISYAPDLFGANARAVENLVAQADQQRFELAAARLAVASNVVLAAIQDSLLRAQLAQVRAIIDQQEETSASFQRQHRLGQVSENDLAAQAALLAQAKAMAPPLERQYRINRDLMAALVGRTPAEPVNFDASLESLEAPKRLPLSLPADLVRHRPDIGVAEAQLHAASALVGVAQAAEWPNLQIDASAGGAAIGLAPGFGSAATFWSLAGTLTQPLFDGGALRHREKAAVATYEQAAALYRATVVGAFQNTADALHALATDADAVAAATQAETAADAGLDIARRQYALGDVGALTVLAARQAAEQARLAALQAAASRDADTVALFEALGGDRWNDGPP